MKTILIILGFALNLMKTGMAQTQAAPHKVISAYYYSDTAAKIPFEKLDYINYSFADVEKGVVSFKGKERERRFKKFLRKVKGQKTKIILAIGGWAWSENFSDMALTKASRDRFIQSCLKVLKKYKLNGIDIDWEYPVIEGQEGNIKRPEDKVNFTLLLKEMHKAFASKYEISFAAGAFDDYFTQSVEWKRIEPYVSRVNLMTYDFVGGYSSHTGNNAALYSTPRQKKAIDNAVAYLKKEHFDLHKIILGIPFYGRAFKTEENNQHGLYTQAKFIKSIDYKIIKDSILIKDSPFMNYWDDTTKSNYLYHKNTRTFITYDSPRSIKIKMDYLIKKGLGGAMFWELGADTESYDLLNEIYKRLRH